MIRGEVIQRRNQFTLSEIARRSKDDNRTRFAGTRNRLARIHMAILMTRKKSDMPQKRFKGRAKIVGVAHNRAGGKEWWSGGVLGIGAYLEAGSYRLETSVPR